MLQMAMSDDDEELHLLLLLAILTISLPTKMSKERKSYLYIAASRLFFFPILFAFACADSPVLVVLLIELKISSGTRVYAGDNEEITHGVS